MKASKFMFGIVLSITIIAIMSGFISNFVVNYDKTLPDKFNSSMQTMEDTEQITTELQTQKASALNEGGDAETDDNTFFDIVGFWLSNGVRAVKSTATSFSVFRTMATDGLDASSEALGIAYSPVRFLLTSFIIIAVTFIIISALIKKDV